MKRRNRQNVANKPLPSAAFRVDNAGPGLLTAHGNRPKELALLLRQLEVAAILNEVYGG